MVNDKFKRKRSDYAWMAGFYLVLIFAGEKTFPQRSTSADVANMERAFNILKLESTLGQYLFFLLITAFGLCALTSSLWIFFRILRKTPDTHLGTMLKTIAPNLTLFLPAYQVVWEYLILKGWTKVTSYRTSPQEILFDTFLWMLIFELTWYFQHRLMHDNKWLWTNGHEYHHQWKNPEHMIGVTNFAFDALVECWVTMSSSFLPLLIFPMNWYVRNIVGLRFSYIGISSLCVTTSITTTRS